MNRREYIKQAVLILGGTFSTPTLMAMQKFESADFQTKPLASYQFSSIEMKIVSEIADLIIPKSETPGALDVGVPQFIEMMLRDCYGAPQHKMFKVGFQFLVKDKFLELDSASKVSYLQVLEKESKPKPTSFWKLTKELTMLGYFTSEQGLKSSFDYHQIPGKFEVIKLSEGQKSYAY